MIAVVSDTHMPKGKRQLPEKCVETIGAAAAVIHAGDFSEVSVLSELEALCPVVLGVYGNVDEPALWQRLPETLEVEVGGLIDVVDTEVAAKPLGRLIEQRL